MDSSKAFLVIIKYPPNVGYAIGRLISAFYDMAVQCAGHTSKVHFSFTDLDCDHCPTLPPSFNNIIAFDPRRSTPRMVKALTDYVQANRIKVVFGLDIQVHAAYLGPLRKAGVETIVSYYGAPLGTVLPKWLWILKRIEVAWFRPHKPDHFILESEAIRQTAIFGRGIRPDATSVVRTGVRLEKFTPVPQRRTIVYQEFSIPENRKIVVYMGHFHRRKGVHILLRAARRIVIEDGRRDVHFLFLGNRAEDLERFGTAIDLSDIIDFVTLAGYREDIVDLLSGCAMGCIPSVGWDSFPMSSLEMQACGLPVIVSDCQGVPETIVKGRTGLVVPAGDDVALAQAISSLVDAPESLLEMKMAARKHVEETLTHDIQISNLVRVVNAVVSSNARD